jgi:hypothetical protein
LNISAELALEFDNECHTLSRGDCYLQEQKRKGGSKFSYLLTEHLFYNAESSAKKVFGFEDIEEPKLTFLE